MYSLDPKYYSKLMKIVALLVSCGLIMSLIEDRFRDKVNNYVTNKILYRIWRSGFAIC